MIGVLLLKVKGLLVNRRLSKPAGQPGVQLVIVTGQQMLSCQHGLDLEVQRNKRVRDASPDRDRTANLPISAPNTSASRSGNGYSILIPDNRSDVR